jgi:hypothetical protein
MSNKAKAFLIALLTLSLSLSLFPDDFFLVKEQVLDESRFKIGFVYCTPLFLLQNVGYTSSVYTYTDRENPDWTGDIGIGLRASAVAANRLILQAEDLPYYSFYLENENLRTWSNSFAARAFSYVNLFNIKAGFQRDDLNQRPNLEFSRPYKYASNQGSGAVDYGRHDNLFVTIFAETGRMEYDDDPISGSASLAESLNHTRNTYGLRLSKRIFTNTIVFTEYEHGNYAFSFSRERDAESSRLAVGVEFPRIGILQGKFQIGLKRFFPDNPLYREVDRANGSGEVNLTLGDRVKLHGSYELDTLFSFGASELFYDNSRFGFGADVYVTRFLKAGGTYSDGRLKYRSFIDLRLQRTDRVRQQEYHLAVPFFGKTSIGLAYNVYRLTSDALNLDYTRSYWGGFLSYEF